MATAFQTVPDSQVNPLEITRMLHFFKDESLQCLRQKQLVKGWKHVIGNYFERRTQSWTKDKATGSQAHIWSSNTLKIYFKTSPLDAISSSIF